MSKKTIIPIAAFSFGVKTCNVSRHYDPKDSRGSCLNCTRCAICGDPMSKTYGSTSTYMVSDKLVVYYHSACLECASPSPIYSIPGKWSTLKIIKREDKGKTSWCLELSCSDHCNLSHSSTCKKCKYTAAPGKNLLDVWPDADGPKQTHSPKYHLSCLPNQFCPVRGCEQPLDRPTTHSKLIWAEGEVIHDQHGSLGKRERAQTCHVCTKYIIDINKCRKLERRANGVATSIYYVHRGCQDQIKCRRCDVSDLSLHEDYKTGEFFHARECTPAACTVCGKIIGASPWITVDHTPQHRSCLPSTECYVCEKPFTDINASIGSLLTDNVGLRCRTCDPRPCQKCQLPIGDFQSQEFDGGVYHNHISRLLPGGRGIAGCLPTCAECSKGNAENDPFVRGDDGLYRHQSCSLDEVCDVCYLRLGSREKWYHNAGNRRHTQCVFKCEKCKTHEPFLVKMPKPKVLEVANLPYLPSYHKQVLRIFLLCMKRYPFLDRNIGFKIVKFYLRSIYREVEPCFPFLNGFDRRLYCNPHYCKDPKTKSCHLCQGEMLFAPGDTTRCHKKLCRQVGLAFRKAAAILKIAVDWDWPRHGDVDNAFKLIAVSYLKDEDKLTHEDRVRYDGLIKAISMINPLGKGNNN